MCQYYVLAGAVAGLAVEGVQAGAAGLRTETILQLRPALLTML